jgi:hypothetical protein
MRVALIAGAGPLITDVAGTASPSAQIGKQENSHVIGNNFIGDLTATYPPC